MSIVNSVATFLPDSGQLVQRTAVAILQASSPQAVTLPSSGSISPPVVRGKARCKIYNQTVAISVTLITLTGTDGTNTVTLANFNGTLAISATAYLDVNFDFLTDTSTAGGGATGTLIFGGMTSLTFTVTTTGASGAASGDFEISAQP